MSSLTMVLLLVALFCHNLTPSESISFQEFVTLTPLQDEIFQKFKVLVSFRLPHDYMKQDGYLIRWIRDSNFDINKAEKKLLANVAWRRGKRVDSILTEDWSEFSGSYKWFVEGCDRQGKLIASINLGDWDIRKEIVAGKLNKLMRYSEMIVEEQFLTVRRMMENGQNATQIWILIDGKNMNAIQHMCASCYAVYLNMVNVIQQFYPMMIHKVVIVNAGQTILPIIQQLKTFIAVDISDSFFVFGTDRKSWQKELLREIDPSQLAERFGGSKQEATEVEEIKKSNYHYDRCI